MVSLIERDHANVSFCSNHILGTALPPPSVGGLRRRGPVTCGFAGLRPAPSRRPRAVGAVTTRSHWRGASSRQGARPLLAAFRGCSVRARAHLPCSPRRHAPAGVWPRSNTAEPSALAPPHPRAASPGVGAPSAASLPSRLASLISELASHEVPGFGAPALPSALGLGGLASALAIARDHGVSASGRATILPPPPRHPAGESSAEMWPSLPVQRHPRGSNRVGEEGRVNEELSGSPGRVWTRQTKMLSMRPAKVRGFAGDQLGLHPNAPGHMNRGSVGRRSRPG
jgi:hypothetical protein